MSKQRGIKRITVSLGLVAAVVLAPGCSTMRHSGGGYYSSSDWYEDVGSVFIFGLGFMFGVFSGYGHGHSGGGYYYNSGPNCSY